MKCFEVDYNKVNEQGCREASPFANWKLPDPAESWLEGLLS
jgi:hypothetical protein